MLVCRANGRRSKPRLFPSRAPISHEQLGRATNRVMSVDPIARAEMDAAGGVAAAAAAAGYRIHGDSVEDQGSSGTAMCATDLGWLSKEQLADMGLARKEDVVKSTSMVRDGCASLSRVRGFCFAAGVSLPGWKHSGGESVYGEVKGEISVGVREMEGKREGARARVRDEMVRGRNLRRVHPSACFDAIHACGSW